MIKCIFLTSKCNLSHFTFKLLRRHQDHSRANLSYKTSQDLSQTKGQLSGDHARIIPFLNQKTKEWVPLT